MHNYLITLTLSDEERRQTYIADGRFPDKRHWTLDNQEGTVIFRVDGIELDCSVPEENILGHWAIHDENIYRLFIEAPNRDPWQAFTGFAGRLALAHPEWLSPGDWQKFAGEIHKLGYDVTDWDQTRRTFEHLVFLGKQNHKPGYILQNDQEQVAKRLFNHADTSDPGWHDRANFLEKAGIKTFGTTEHPNLAGYLTRNGTLLNFSLQNWQRDIDHREIEEIDPIHYDEMEPYERMMDFINHGNIRCGSYSLCMTTAPTQAQRRVISRMVRTWQDDTIYLDFMTQTGTTANSMTCPIGTSAAEILRIIDRYFATGFAHEKDSP